MKAVLISIQPKWVEKIANGEKTIEVRKTAPKCEVPFKCYIYATKKARLQTIFKKGEWIFSDDHSFGKFDENIFVKDSLCAWQGKIIGEFVCDWITKITPNCDIDGCVNQYTHGYPAILGDNDCLSFNDMKAYLGNKKGYDWHISDLKIYDKPKELSEFYTKKTCNSCKKSGHESTACMYDEDCKVPMPITRAPQSWQYVEEI